MRRNLIAVLVTVALVMVAWPTAAPAQEPTKIEREKLSLAGWDPDEPVPAYFYYPKGKEALPAVIFVHGLGGSKDAEAKRVQELAGKGFFVVAIDAHLHGERKVPSLFVKNLSNLGDDHSILRHQAAS